MSEHQYKVGDRVILGKHQLGGPHNISNWSSEMDAFVGKEATITNLVSSSSDGFPKVRVDIDNGMWVWRQVNLTLVGSQQTSVASGAKCQVCKEYNPYVSASDSFRCYTCRR